jgi:hypothetical protein
MTARFQRQRVGNVLGKLVIRQQAFKHSLALAAFQTFEGRDKNFRRGLRCAHDESMLPMFDEMTTGF